MSVLIFIILLPAFAFAAEDVSNQTTQTGPPAIEGPSLGVLPSVVTNETASYMALTSVTGIPTTLMVQVTSGDKTVAVIKGHEVLYSQPFWVDKIQTVELHLAGQGLPTNSRLTFEPVKNEIWGELNINIIPENSELKGQFEITVLRSDSTLTGQLKINIFN
ncbi:hypothetical protein [Desulfotomaculum nigrificans]|uniref:hypothetical protein n=1 Tax=Desulfotomaculum nigrificans TaxID=1565 RepID=UPI0001FAE59F|nr:hypothetical protein [Desulfotomaculum nigrificans]